jgi:hypothetical protein
MGSDEPGQREGPEPREGEADGKAAATRRSALDAEGMERPAFILDFPEDPDLQRLVRAFERGNYAEVRRDAERLAESTTDPAVRDAARELRRRIDPDPLAKYLLAISVLLLVFLVIWAYKVQAR